MTVLPLLKKQHRLKLLMLWLAIACGHLGHTASHYLHIELPHAYTPHEGDETPEHSDEAKHSDAGTCVTCIAFAIVFLELNRSVGQSNPYIRLEVWAPSSARTINLGMEIALRPGQPRAPPVAA